MQITIKPYYTIPCSVLLQYPQHLAKPAAHASIRLNILIDIPDAAMPALFSLLGTIENDCLFSLPHSIFNDKTVLQSRLPSFYLLASHFRLSLTTAPVIPVFYNDPVDPADVSLITAYFEEQGIEDLELPLFCCNTHAPAMQETKRCSCYTCDTDHLPGKLEVSRRVSFIVFNTAIADLTGFFACAAQMSTVMDIDNLWESYIEKDTCDQELQRWKKRSLLYRHFLELSKTVQEKEYYEVLDWYKKEYEILPLWYKRFGHIVKVIMGKRRFQSLFSDHVKKYKD